MRFQLAVQTGKRVVEDVLICNNEWIIVYGDRWVCIHEARPAFNYPLYVMREYDQTITNVVIDSHSVIVELGSGTRDKIKLALSDPTTATSTTKMYSMIQEQSGNQLIIMNDEQPMGVVNACKFDLGSVCFGYYDRHCECLNNFLVGMSAEFLYVYECTFGTIIPTDLGEKRKQTNTSSTLKATIPGNPYNINTHRDPVMFIMKPLVLEGAVYLLLACRKQPCVYEVCLHEPVQHWTGMVPDVKDCKENVVREEREDDFDVCV